MIKKLCLLFTLIFVFVSCGNKPEDSEEARRIKKIETNKIKTFKAELKAAIISSDLNIVKQKLNESTDIGFLFDNGETPLTYSLKHSKSSIIRLLSKFKVLLNKKNIFDEIPINLLIKTNKLSTSEKEDLVPQMILNGLVISTPSLTSPLILAIESELEPLAITLAKFGADLSFKTIKGESALDFAINKQMNRLTQLLEFIDAHQQVDLSFLEMAITNNNQLAIDYMLINFSDYYEIIDKNGVLNNAVLISDNRHRLEIVTKLLTLNVNPNGAKEITPLMLAAMVPNDMNIATVYKLIKFDADLLIQNKSDNNRTALSYALENLNIRTVLKIYSKAKTISDSEKEEVPGHDELTTDYRSMVDTACQYLPNSRDSRRLNSNGLQIRRSIINLLGCNQDG